MSTTDVKFRERYPEYADFVIDPDTMGVFSLIEPLEVIYIFMEKGTEIKKKEFEKFLGDCYTWKKTDEATFPEYFFENLDAFLSYVPEVVNDCVIGFIQQQLKKIPSKGAKLNYLIRIKADVLHNLYFYILPFEKEEILRFLNVEIDAWKEYTEPELGMNSPEDNFVEIEEFIKKGIATNFTAAMKVMLLNEFGVLDCLSTKYPKIPHRKLGFILATIISERPDTIRKTIDSIRNQHSDQKNNPYGNEENVKWANSFHQLLNLPK